MIPDAVVPLLREYDVSLFGSMSPRHTPAGAAFVAAAAACVLSLGLWAWTAGFDGPFHFDDRVTPLGDPASQSMSAWQEHLAVTLRPLTKLSYALEAEAGLAAEPAPRRSVSIIVLAISAGLLFLLISHLTPGLSTLGAFLPASAWFLHPVHADTVLMLSGRSAVLSTAFLLAALLALDRSRQWWAALLFLLACLSRETALAGLLPLVVLAATQPKECPRAVLRALIPLLAATVLIVLWLLTTPRYLDLAEYSFLGRPFQESFIAQVGALPVGLKLLFDTAALSIDYGIALPENAGDLLFLLGLALYVAAAAGVMFFWRRSRAASVGLALWIAALLPTQSFIPKLDALSNRPLSLALAGLLLAAAPMVAGLSNRLRSETRGLVFTGSRLALMACSAAVLLALAQVTIGRAGLFESELLLWQDAASKSTSNARPHLQYALLLLKEDRESEAREALLMAQQIDPFSARIEALLREPPRTRSQ